MPWDDDFLDELQSSTGLTPEQLVEVIQRTDPSYRAELARREQAEAKAKARTLLLDHLGDEQRAMFEAHHHFDVISSAGRRFRLTLGREGNVFLMPDVGDQAVRSFCIHLRDRVPDEDNVLAQMLALQTDEAAFLRVAGIR